MWWEGKGDLGSEGLSRLQEQHVQRHGKEKATLFSELDMGVVGISFTVTQEKEKKKNKNNNTHTHKKEKMNDVTILTNFSVFLTLNFKLIIYVIYHYYSIFA